MVGIDGSPSARAALRWALAQAKWTGARVQAVAAWEFPAGYSWGSALPSDKLAEITGKVLGESVSEARGFEQPRVEVLESVVPGRGKGADDPPILGLQARTARGLAVIG